MTLDLVVFDCDGVLVDSEALVVGVESEMLSAAGFVISADEIAERFVGLSYTTMMAAIESEHGRPVPPQLNREIQQTALDLFPSDLLPVPGIEDLLAGLERERCVASSSDLDRINLSLSVCGLQQFFAPERIFSAQMVSNGKPAPDLFLLAAEQSGAATDGCLVIEDSPAGVTAARAAGMAVVGLVAGGHARPSLGDRLLAAGADEVFGTVVELQDHLAAL